MEDNFDVNGAPNPKIWTYDVGRGPNGDGWGNEELQYYTNRPENVIVQNGYLIITAQKENFEGASYTSARLNTKGKFAQQYGRFEARMKLPSGKGIWPAFWMLGNNIDTATWPQCGEIDIMEVRGSQPTVTTSAIHGPGYSKTNPVTKAFTFTNNRVDTDFHVYGVEWEKDYINFYVDNVLYNQLTPTSKGVNGEWVFNSNPFFLLLNLAVGGKFDGNPNADTTFPQRMIVDYVRVYQ